MSKKNPERQPDLGYIDSEGKLRDDGLHDEMLSSKAGNAASRKAARGLKSANRRKRQPTRTSLAIASRQLVRCAETAEPFPKGLPVKETRLRGFLIPR